MEITIHTQTQWSPGQGTAKINFWNRWLSILDNQENNKTLWYIISMIVQGILFLPVPAAMIYYFNAPLLLLPVTLILFFGNIIAGMGGASIRVILYWFLTSVMIHLTMLAFYLL